MEILKNSLDYFQNQPQEERRVVDMIVSRLRKLSLLTPQVQEKPLEINIDLNVIEKILASYSAVFVLADPWKILEFQLVLKFNTDGGVVTKSKPEISYFARDTQEQQLQQVLNQLFKIVPEAQWIISKTISNSFYSISWQGMCCVQKDITQELQQYYSPFKSEYVCAECAEAGDKEKKGNQRYKYLDTLVFINGPLSDPSVLHNIDDHKLGSNMKLQDGEEGSQKHNTICNGCHSEDEKGPKYISVTAKSGKLTGNGYVDYCQKCFLQLKDKASDKAQELVALDAKQGMVLDSLFTRVLFNYGGYWNF